MSCKEQINDYVTLKGQFSNLTEQDTVLRVNSRTYHKDIKFNADGSFSDTLHIKEPGYFSVSLNRRTHFSPYLNIGDDLVMSGDAQDLNNNLSFEGRGAESNNYLIKRIKEVQTFQKEIEQSYDLDSIPFFEKVNAFEDHINTLLSNKEIDTAVVSREKLGLNGYIEGLKKNYPQRHKTGIKLAKGKASPKFENLENYNGGTTSLYDFKGKFVYIDVWATWCKPCLGQIPALKDLEKEYEGKDIVFVSISSDRPDKHEEWKNMIKTKGMGGEQLFAGENVSFFQEYQISSIPRFIFIDKEGNIYNNNAPRPSETERVKQMFTEAGVE